MGELLSRLNVNHYLTRFYGLFAALKIIMNQVRSTRSSVSFENADQLVRQKSSEVGVGDRRKLGDVSHNALAPVPRLHAQQLPQQLPKQQAGNLAVPRQRFGGSRSNSASSNGSRQLNSVSSLNSIPESTPARSTTQLKVVEDIDAQDSDNPQLVSIYVKDVYVYLRFLEEKFSVRPTYMTLDPKPEISPRMRTILIDWLIQVHSRFSLLQETLFLAIGILDRYLQDKIKEIGRKKLQLVGITAMWIAAKYEEIYAPEVNDFVYITDNAYSSAELRKMELDILRTLNYNLGRPLALHFLRRNSKAGEVDSVQHALAKFFMEVTLQEYSMVHLAPSLISAAALWLAIQIDASATVWSDKLRHYSGYEESEITSLGSKIADLVVKLPTTKSNFVFTKYQSGKFLKIATTPFISGPVINNIARMMES